MSARHRHHKKRTREVERDLEHNYRDDDAARRVMAWLLEHGHEKSGIACHTLEHMLADLEHDRAALLEIVRVLSPDDWRWRVRERWRTELSSDEVR